MTQSVTRPRGRRTLALGLAAGTTAVALALPGTAGAQAAPTTTTGPSTTSTTHLLPAGSMLLSRSRANPAVFVDRSGKPVYLQGSYIGLELQDYIFGSPNPSDWSTAVAVLKNNHANFLRMWTAETTGAVGSTTPLVTPMPWKRSTVCCDLDGGNKFDLDQLDVGDLAHPALNSNHYFERLRARVLDARKRGIYVSVMLFHSFGWENSVRIPGLDIWSWHPFNAANNINGVDPDSNHDGSGLELGSLGNAWQSYQNAYIKQVVDSVGDLDNVAYEVCNECYDTPATNAWQNAVITNIHQYEAQAGDPRHPVGMTSLQDYNNQVLADSKADFVSPGGAGLEASPPIVRNKVSILDQDHILPCSNQNSPLWPWKALARGNGLWYIYCGPSGDGISYGDPSTTEQAVMTRMGLASQAAKRLNLLRLRPTDDAGRCSSTYCLVGKSALFAYLPTGDSVTVQLPSTGRYSVRWINGQSGLTVRGPAVHGPAVSLISPWGSQDASVYLSRS